MIDHLQNDHKKQVLYFFFSFRNMAQNTLHDLLRACVSQYLRLNPDLLPVADQWLDTSAQPAASLKVLKKHFKEILLTCTDPEPIYLILDGLDECDNAEQSLIQSYLSDTLQEAIKIGKPHLIRLCVISREIKLQRAFSKLVRRRKRIGKEDNRMDISHYVISELHKVKEDLDPHIRLNDGYIQELTKILTEKAEGKHIRSLCRKVRLDSSLRRSNYFLPFILQNRNVSLGSVGHSYLS